MSDGWPKDTLVQVIADLTGTDYDAVSGRSYRVEEFVPAVPFPLQGETLEPFYYLIPETGDEGRAYCAPAWALRPLLSEVPR